jgi:hypothetical protein
LRPNGKYFLAPSGFQFQRLRTVRHELVQHALSWPRSLSLGPVPSEKGCYRQLPETWQELGDNKGQGSGEIFGTLDDHCTPLSAQPTYGSTSCIRRQRLGILPPGRRCPAMANTKQVVNRGVVFLCYNSRDRSQVIAIGRR